MYCPMNPNRLPKGKRLIANKDSRGLRTTIGAVWRTLNMTKIPLCESPTTITGLREARVPSEAVTQDQSSPITPKRCLPRSDYDRHSPSSARRLGGRRRGNRCFRVVGRPVVALTNCTPSPMRLSPPSLIEHDLHKYLPTVLLPSSLAIFMRSEFCDWRYRSEVA